MSNKTETTMQDEGILEESKPFIVGHLLIRDKKTGEVLVDQRDSASTVKPLGMAGLIGEDNDD